MHRLTFLLFLAMAAISPVAGADGLPYGPTLSFVVMREGQQIGSHKLVFERDGAQLKVATSIDIAVKFVGITAYRYSHRAQEAWNGDVLVSLSSRTDDDGKAHVVQASRTAEGIVVQADGAKRTVLPATIVPSSHWNIRQIAQTVLLNSQKGIEARVKVTTLGREAVKTSSNTLQAMHYRYDGDLKMDQWFDDRSRWVKTSFKGSDGSTIEYVLQK
ncbi:hypothetical protein BH10PSE6_BH10PSE6_40610 [soil metagenome]